MGNWDEASKKAAKKVDADMEADGLADIFEGIDLTQVQDPEELKKAEALMKAIKANTDGNERKKAIADFKNAVCAGTYELVKAGAKGAIKAMFALALVFWFAAPARAAESLPIDLNQPPVIDLMPFIKNLGVCSVYTQDRDFLAGACYAPLTWGWGGLNGGVVWDTNGADKSIGGGFGAVSFRADKAWAWAWRGMNLEKRGFRVHFKVPKVEIGPMGGYLQHKGWVYGGFLNGKIPFGGNDEK